MNLFAIFQPMTEERLASETGGKASEWPEHFPQCCPPNNADDLGGIVYMLVATNPPTPKDMECAIDRKTHKSGDPCERASLSCAREAKHLHELRAAVTRLKEHLVAEGVFSPSHGKIKQTGRRGHYSMWLRAEYLVIGETLFEVSP